MWYSDDWVFEPICESGKKASDEPEKPTNPLAFALDNLESVIKTKTDVQYALYRKGLGWIGFTWGYPGKEPPKDENKLIEAWTKLPKGQKKKFPFEGGYGISHIVAKRDWEGRYIDGLIGQKGIDAAKNAIKILLKMPLPRHIRKEQWELVFKRDKYLIVLRRKSVGSQMSEPRWLWSAYEWLDDRKYNLVVGGNVYESVGGTVAVEPRCATAPCSYSSPETRVLLLYEGAHSTQELSVERTPHSPALRTKQSRETRNMGATNSVGKRYAPKPGTAEYGLTLDL